MSNLIRVQIDVESLFIGISLVSLLVPDNVLTEFGSISLSFLEQTNKESGGDVMISLLSIGQGLQHDFKTPKWFSRSPKSQHD